MTDAFRKARLTLLTMVVCLLTFCSCRSDQTEGEWRFEAGPADSREGNASDANGGETDAVGVDAIDSRETETTDGGRDVCNVDAEIPDVANDLADTGECPNPHVRELDEEALEEPCHTGERVCVGGQVRECLCEEWIETGESCCDLEVADLGVTIWGEFTEASHVEGDPSSDECSAVGEATIRIVGNIHNYGTAVARVRCRMGRVWPVDPEGPFEPSKEDEYTEGPVYEIELEKEKLSAWEDVNFRKTVSVQENICPQALWVECRAVDEGDGTAEPEPYYEECVVWTENPDGDGYVPPSKRCHANKVWLPGHTFE